jgi:hypothetical protein
MELIKLRSNTPLINREKIEKIWLIGSAVARLQASAKVYHSTIQKQGHILQGIKKQSSMKIGCASIVKARIFHEGRLATDAARIGQQVPR